MRYFIGAIDGCYRGIDRDVLRSICKKGKMNKNLFSEIMNMYFDYTEEIVERLPSQKGIDFLLEFYQKLSNNGIDCEIVVFDSFALKNCFGYELEFLGFDIACDEAESLISGGGQLKVSHLLNQNGLCKSASDVYSIVPLLNHGNLEWKPCYVYKLLVPYNC